MNERILDPFLDAGRNFRELGGYKTQEGQQIKFHKILRSANLAELTPKDQEFLANYGLKKDIDFRSTAEKNKEPDLVPAGVEYIFNPVFKEDETQASKSSNDIEKQFGFAFDDGYKQMIKVYKDIIIDDKSKKAYRLFFDHLLDNSEDNQVALFHCTAGKDRTGMAAVYFLWALGVDQATIKQDYLLTNDVIKSYVDSRIEELEAKNVSSQTISSVRALMSVQEDYLDTAKKTIITETGSMENYLNEAIGLSKNEIQDLKKIYLR
ncbi:protein-tyrosine-phosphatase [Companilactobacillus sp. RD055328]|uniref:tyrosine-protein phosphatase n=1 Tax=Companilactobacillus sp. RD055328 TaxID=2916634 RepID=UPI001FC896FD|nr:tyrosine-protein phosphatase [Companilactobacillus sp. RD055328]GKQ43241.1 protein-tyrosine-phosphatase [Companilactobacillus sp. RD055328]